jgi:hypothetical protein
LGSKELDRSVVVGDYEVRVTRIGFAHQSEVLYVSRKIKTAQMWAAFHKVSFAVALKK